MDKKKLKFSFSLSLKNIIIFVLLIAVVFLSVLNFMPKKDNAVTDHKTIKMRLENIGELATQVSYSTEVGSIRDSREIFGVKIPFTQSSYIYSYDFIIKAGFDFGAIDCKKEGQVIKVKMPAPEILSNEIKLDTLKVYNNEESIFTNIAPESINDNTSDMKNEAQETAISNGIFDMAKDNAEIIVKAFLSDLYSFDADGKDGKGQYTIEFEYPKEAENEGKD